MIQVDEHDAHQGQDRSHDLDYIIEVSILKIRRMQITGVREERHRLLVLDTLRRSIAAKLEEQEEASRGTQGVSSPSNRTTAFLAILQDAISRLGLSRIVRFCITLPDDDEDLPKLKLPAGGIRKTPSNPGVNRTIGEYSVSQDA